MTRNLRGEVFHYPPYRKFPGVSARPGGLAISAFCRIQRARASQVTRLGTWELRFGSRIRSELRKAPVHRDASDYQSAARAGADLSLIALGTRRPLDRQ